MQTKKEVQANGQQYWNNLQDFPWYFGEISRERAENLLLLNGEDPGTFLVRDAEPQTNPPSYRISVLEFADLKCVVHHYRIYFILSGSYCIDEDHTFPNIPALIQWYSDNATKDCIKLSSPCRKCLHQSSSYYENPQLSFIGELPPLKAEDFDKEEFIFSSKIRPVEIWKGAIRSNQRPVAIKTLSSLSGVETRRMLLNEAKTLHLIAHENIIKLLGIIVNDAFGVVTEFQENRDLLSYFLNGDAYELCLRETIRMAEEIASALTHVSSMQYVHRNIRSQNILLNRNMTCKLAGFSYAQRLNSTGVYFKTADDPEFDNSMCRWQSIEAATDGRFSVASDVWSYSVLLYEMFTKGEMPYAEILTPHIVDSLKRGYRLQRATGIPQSIFNIMQKCWLSDSKLRPTFKDIIDFLHDAIATERQKLFIIIPTSNKSSSSSSSPHRPNSLSR